LPFRKERYWQFGITNTHKRLVEYLAGKIEHSKVTWRFFRGGSTKPCARVQVSGNLRVRCLLLALLPRLIVKKERSLIAIQSIEELEKDVFEFQREFVRSDGLAW
jgi:hypothetical protein